MIKALKKIAFVPEKALESGGLLEQFREDYIATNDFVRATVYWVVGADSVDDVMQATYLKAWLNYGKFNRTSSFKTWIYRIAKNTAYDHLRSEKKSLNNETIETFDVSHQGKDLKDLISQGVLRLNLKHREVFVLFYKMGHTKPEISEILEISEGTVKSRLYYAKEGFVEFLKENGVKDEG